MDKSEYNIKFEQIVNDDSLTDLEKLVQAFDLVTKEAIKHSQHEIELANVMGDKNTALHEQIKCGGIQASRGMFQYCYRNITGSRGKVWDE